MIGWILAFFVTALLSSQSLMDLGSTLIILTILTFWFQKKMREPFPRLGLEKVFAVWWVLILVGLLLNLQPETPWLKNFLEFRWIIEFYFYIWALLHLNPDEKKFHKILPIFFVASIYAVAVFYLKYDPIQQSWADRQNQMVNYRTGGLLYSPMPFAHTYGPLGILLLGPLLLLKPEEWARYKFWILTCGITLFAVVLSFTRGIWIGVAAAAVVMGFLVNWKKGLTALIGVVILATVFILASPSIRERVVNSLNPTQTYDNERLIIWKANWLIFTEHPMFGIGYSENGRRLREYFDRMNVPKDFLESHAHNQYLHYLSGTGLLGLLCFLFVILFLLRLHWQAYRDLSDPNQKFLKGLALGVIGAEICFYVGGLTESNFSIAKNRYALLMIWALGCWLWFKSRSMGTAKK